MTVGGGNTFTEKGRRVVERVLTTYNALKAAYKELSGKTNKMLDEDDSDGAMKAMSDMNRIALQLHRIKKTIRDIIIHVKMGNQFGGSGFGNEVEEAVSKLSDKELDELEANLDKIMAPVTGGKRQKEEHQASHSPIQKIKRCIAAEYSHFSNTNNSIGTFGQNNQRFLWN
jgi:hypothetical protein